MTMTERLEEYSHLLGRIAQKTDDIENSIAEIKTMYHQQITLCRAQFVTKDEFNPIAKKVRFVVMAIVSGFISALGALVYKHG
jgi:hypothetical protein